LENAKTRQLIVYLIRPGERRIGRARRISRIGPENRERARESGKKMI